MTHAAGYTPSATPRPSPGRGRGWRGVLAMRKAAAGAVKGIHPGHRGLELDGGLRGVKSGGGGGPKSRDSPAGRTARRARNRPPPIPLTHDDVLPGDGDGH